ncbi:MAG: LPP20 family lipoprotein, partial [Treponema sp.]|nr:LPP20 family lipoprotein [Treponema sp.]
MFKITVPVISAAILLLGIGCAGSPAVRGNGNAGQSSAAEQAAVDAASAAVAAMQNGGRAAGPSTANPISAGEASGDQNRSQPVWVSSPDAVYSRYDRNVYIAQVGNGADRSLAEKDALARLSAYFRQNIQGEETSSTRYQEAMRNGVVESYSENTTLTNTVRTSLELDTLVGAEIGDYWFDGRSVHYAVALMEKAKASVVYADMIEANRELIKGLTAMTDKEKYSMDGYARYRLAANIADVNSIYGNVLSLAGTGGTGIAPDKLEKGDSFRLEAANITKNIPIGVQVANDRSNRIASAFSQALGRAGFRTGTRNSPYVLDVKISFAPVDLPNQQNKFVRYVVDANLTATATGVILLPYNINGREGHLNIPEAENRAVTAAE